MEDEGRPIVEIWGSEIRGLGLPLELLLPIYPHKSPRQNPGSAIAGAHSAQWAAAMAVAEVAMAAAGTLVT